MKLKIFYVLFFLLFAASISHTVSGNANNKEYCEELLDSAKNSFFARDYAKSLEILTELQPIVKNNGFLEIELSILNLFGLIYKDLLVYDKAMDYFLEFYRAAIKYGNLKAESFALNNIAVLYEENNEYDKVLDYLEKAYNVSLKLDDDERTGEIAINIAHMAIVAGDITLAEQYINIAENSQKKEKRLQIYNQIITTELLLSKEEYSAAESLALSILQEDVALEYRFLFFSLLSKIYQQKGNFEKAVYYLHEILKEKPTLKETIAVYEKLSDLYRDNNFLALSLQYKDSVLLARDSLYRISNQQYVETNRIQMKLLNSEKQLAENKAKQRGERILFIVIISVIVVFLLMLIWFFHLRSVKNKQWRIIELEKEKNEKLALEQELKDRETVALLEQQRLQNEVNEKLLLKQQLREQEMGRMLEQERLNNEIETKNKQLIAKALSQSSRDELLREVISLLSKMSQESENPQLGLTIRKLNAQLKNSMEWDNFLTQFEKINPSFFHSLKEDYPSLTANDIHLLSYIYLNLDTQRMAYLLNISVEACRKKKQRLATKMGQKTDELYEFLVNKIKFSMYK